MPKVMFDKTIKLNGIKFLPNEPVEVTDEQAEVAVTHGGWIVLSEDKEPKAVEPVKEEQEVPDKVQELVDNSTRKELIEMAKEFDIADTQSKNKTELATEIIEFLE